MSRLAPEAFIIILLTLMIKLTTDIFLIPSCFNLSIVFPFLFLRYGLRELQTVTKFEFTSPSCRKANLQSGDDRHDIEISVVDSVYNSVNKLVLSLLFDTKDCRGFFLFVCFSLDLHVAIKIEFLTIK